MAKLKKLASIHPGEILREDFMIPLNLSMNKLAIHLRVPVTRIGEIVHERRSITPDTAMRLAAFFRMTPQFWLNLQQAYDLANVQDKLADEIRKEDKQAVLISLAWNKKMVVWNLIFVLMALAAALVYPTKLNYFNSFLWTWLAICCSQVQLLRTNRRIDVLSNTLEQQCDPSNKN